MQDHEPLSCDIMCYTTDNEPWWRHMLAIPIECGAFLTFNVPVTRAKRCGPTPPLCFLVAG